MSSLYIGINFYHRNAILVNLIVKTGYSYLDSLKHHSCFIKIILSIFQLLLGSSIKLFLNMYTIAPQL